MNRLLTLFCLVAVLFSCNSKQPTVKVIGDKIVISKTEKGEYKYDTVSAKAPDFYLLNQNGNQFCKKELKGKIYVVDFFFTHCPSICVTMKKNLLQVHEKYGDNSGVVLVSVSIDPNRDSVSVLFDYARKLGVEQANWNFLTGDKDSIYALADKFLALAEEDENSPGGFIHDGNFILVDRNGAIRGFYDGTDAKSVDLMIDDIGILIGEKQ